MQDIKMLSFVFVLLAIETFVQGIPAPSSESQVSQLDRCGKPFTVQSNPQPEVNPNQCDFPENVDPESIVISFRIEVCKYY